MFQSEHKRKLIFVLGGLVLVVGVAVLTVTRSRASSNQWNVLIFLMESTGAEYPFKTRYGNKLPMPFLQELSRNALVMQNHFSPSNSTPRGSFAIMSGMFPEARKYELKGAPMFVQRRDVKIPSIKQFLPRSYDWFYVLNGDLTWFFPRWFYQNNGIRVYAKEELKKQAPPTPSARGRNKWGRAAMLGLNESQLVDFFIKRLEKTREPFGAVYHSFIAHYPYFNFGPRYDLFRERRRRCNEKRILLPKEAVPEKKRKGKRYRIRIRKGPLPRGTSAYWRRVCGYHITPFERDYYNNLRLMDVLIKRIVTRLRESGRLKRTILVFVGDHGEAFGRPRGVWVHSRHSYNVNYRTPLIIYQPRLFKPGVVRARTMHPDIVPTLLSAMGVPYDARQFQGESILKLPMKRRYDFLNGNEGTVSSISRDTDIKMQIRWGRCWVYDLKRDPRERRRRSCRRHREQYRALRSFIRLQNRMLRRYSRARQRGESFVPGRPTWWNRTPAALVRDNPKSARGGTRRP